MVCPHCNSEWTVKNGKRRTGIQQYKCNACKKSFCETTGTIMWRKRYPVRVVKMGVLFVQYVSTRVTSYFLKQLLDIKPSHQTIYNWAVEFAQLLSEKALSLSQLLTNIWHVDEKFVKVADQEKDAKGRTKFSYLWIVSDSNSNIIAPFVSHKRDKKSAEKALILAKKNAGFCPELLVSDSYPAYVNTVKKVFGRKTKHVQAHFETKGVMHKGKLYYLSNNKAESLNSKVNLWYKKFRGFKTLKTANLWCASFANFYNHLRPSTRQRSSPQLEFQQLLLA